MNARLVLLMGAALVMAAGCNGEEGAVTSPGTGAVALAGPGTGTLRADGETMVRGTVTDVDALPLEGVTVFVRVCEGDSSAVQGEHEFLTETDVNGLFSISGVPVGTHKLIARLRTYERHMEDFDITKGQTVEFDIVLEAKDGEGYLHRHRWEGEGGPHGSD